MAGFDPYWKWLGIPPREHPPNHYRLLGIELFESDPDVIGNSADRQMGHVRTFQSGRHSALSQRILNELAAARVCLLDPAKKAAYDAQLRRELPSESPPKAPPTPPPPLLAPPASPQQRAAAEGVATKVGGAPVDEALAPTLSPTVGWYVSRKRKPAVAVSTVALMLVLVLGGLAFLVWWQNNPVAPPPTSSPEVRQDGTPPNGAKRNGNPISPAPSPSKPAHDLPEPDSGMSAGRGAEESSPGRVPDTSGTGAPKAQAPTPDPGEVKRPGDLIGDTAAPDREPPPGPPKPPPAQPRVPARPPERMAVPGQSSLDLAEAQVRNGPLSSLFDAAATKAGKADLSRRLFAEAGKAEGDPAKVYVMLRLTRDLASEAGDFEVAVAAIESLGKQYEVDTAAMTAAMMKPLGELPSLAHRRRAIVSNAALLRHLGATEASQAAVEGALAWLARHQNADGSWSFNHVGPKCKDQCPNPGILTQAPNAATALALLPFLGAGRGQGEDEYQKPVVRGLSYLSKNRKEIRTTRGPSASFHDRMAPTAPAHTLATIALCESYESRGDAKLRTTVQHAVSMILATQNDDGGWGTNPTLVYPDSRDPDVSDVQTTGWNITALRVAQWQGFQVPADVLARADAYLDTMVAPGNLGYFSGARLRAVGPDSTAVAFLSRIYLGWPRTQPQLRDYVARTGRAGLATTGRYFLNYLQDQVLQDCSGPTWEPWNAALRDHLVATQRSDGHAAGSWFVDSPDGGNRLGGRLFCTALAALTLEVYYRYPPLD